MSFATKFIFFLKNLDYFNCSLQSLHIHFHEVVPHNGSNNARQFSHIPHYNIVFEWEILQVVLNLNFSFAIDLLNFTRSVVQDGLFVIRVKNNVDVEDSSLFTFQAEWSNHILVKPTIRNNEANFVSFILGKSVYGLSHELGQTKVSAHLIREPETHVTDQLRTFTWREGLIEWVKFHHSVANG